MLRFVKSVTINWYPSAQKSSTALHFLSMCESPKAMSSNPDVIIQNKMIPTLKEASIELEFANGSKRLFNMTHTKVPEIVEEIDNYKDEMELIEEDENEAEEDITQFLSAPQKKDKPGQVEKKGIRTRRVQSNRPEKS